MHYKEYIDNRLDEKYFNTVRGKNVYDNKLITVEIFKNPTKQEIVSVARSNKYLELRIVYTKSGDIYIWSGDLSHSGMFEYNSKLKKEALDTYYYSLSRDLIMKDRFEDYGKNLTDKQMDDIVKTLKKYFKTANVIPELIFRYNPKYIKIGRESVQLTEMPWTEYKGIAIDYEFEKPGWVERLIDNLTEYGADIILKPFYDNKIYKQFLNKSFKKLNSKEKEMLLDELPQKFINDMRLA